MRKPTSIVAMMLMMLMILPACKRDVYGDLFINRELVTLRVQSDDGRLLSNVSVKAEEVDTFDNDPIIDRTQYVYTDADGLATLEVAFSSKSEPLLDRTTRFTFTATDYAVFDTIFNYWEGTIDIVLQRE